MRKQFSRRRSVDRGKRDEKEMRNQKSNADELPTLPRDVITMNTKKAKRHRRSMIQKHRRQCLK